MSINLYWLISKINITIKTITALRFINFSTRYFEFRVYFTMGKWISEKSYRMFFQFLIDVKKAYSLLA